MNKNDTTEFVLVSAVGLTDPIRSEYDGPILHIVRYYHPKLVVLILTSATGERERKYSTMQNAISMVDKECKIECKFTDIEAAHSFDSFSQVLLSICADVRDQYKDEQILLNITSGTPQMETALGMIALSDPKRYLPIQVDTPANAPNKTDHFDPEKDELEDWFETDLDNEPGSVSRCHVPKLMNFRRPMAQLQIQSLIRNYDYAGAIQLLDQYPDNFRNQVRVLLNHAKYRLNLEHDIATSYAKKAGAYKELYPITSRQESGLIEYFNSMRAKRSRGELHDFSLRMEVFTVEFASYCLEKCFGVSREDITNVSLRGEYRWNQEKAEHALPGISNYMDDQFRSSFKWEGVIGGRSMVHFLKYADTINTTGLYRGLVEEIEKWPKLSAEVRNVAAHTMAAITDQMIIDAYGNDSERLCQNIQRHMYSVMKKKIGEEPLSQAFDIYKTINEKICDAMNEPVS